MEKRITFTEEELRNISIEIAEGLIKTYNMDISKTFMKKKFPNILRIVSLDKNPYMENGEFKKTKNNDFIGIVLDYNNVENYMQIIKTANDLLGWFTGHIQIRQKVRNGYIPYIFYNYGNKFVCNDKFGREITLSDFLNENFTLGFFAIILEAKFGEIYHQKPNEIFYHAANPDVIHKILKQGLTPRSNGNHPDRIYLGKNLSEIYKMVGVDLNKKVLLRVDVSNIKLFKLYRDNRNSTAVFTYDNIPPSQIEILDDNRKL